MKWFEGDINSAVSKSKSEKAIFVVFIEGTDDKSKQVAEAIESPEVSSRLEKHDFVAIKLKSGSESYTFFVQIYQLVPVPSVFFIGTDGRPLEIIADSIDPSEMSAKIDTILTKCGKPAGSSSAQMIQAEQQSTLQQRPESSSQQSTQNVQASSSSEAVAVPTSPVLSAEEKMERARQLIELQKQKREEEEKQKEKERELQRRKMGQDVQRLRKEQQELEVRQATEERKREKAEEMAARERVRQQIAQDKLERKQRAMQEQNVKKEPQQEPKKPPQVAADGVVRIQFRLPSGASHAGKFEPTSTLATLRRYVIGNIELPFQQFSMSTTFPRRDLTAQDDDKTLLQLELVPTAVILILPFRSSSKNNAVASSTNDGFLFRIMWTFLSPFVGIYNYIRGYFGGGGGAVGGNSGERRPEPSNANASSIPSQFQNLPPGLLRRNLGNSTTVRAQGNVHRLHSGRDDEDENNTWNGNSTQQM